MFRSTTLVPDRFLYVPRSTTIVLFCLALAACGCVVSALPPSYKIAAVAGTGSGSSSGDGGQATSASLNNPIGMWQDSVGTLFISENQGHKVRAVSSSGIISTVAGTGTPSFSGDNGPVRLLHYHIIIS
jgi:hypothetical protein